MPDYELHADFDQDGRISATPDEYRLRGTAPGAIVLPNIDADGRGLPPHVSAGPAITLDWERPTKTGNDNDLLPLRIIIRRPSAPPGCHFFLSVAGATAPGAQLYDATGHRIPVQAGPPDRYPLAFTGNVLNVRLEVQTLRGSPTLHPATLATALPSVIDDEAHLVLELFCVDAGGQMTRFDRAVTTIAPVIIPANTAAATRLYVCTLPDNEPSVSDLQAALAFTPSVTAVTVPLEVSMGDGWLQDQFQHAVCQGPTGWMHVILHLPRLRSNVVQSRLLPNLAGFVTSHFPSRNLGLFQDFWRRTLPVQDAQGHAQTLAFERSHELLMQLERVRLVRRFLLDLLGTLDPSAVRPADPADWFEDRRSLRTVLQRVSQAIVARERDAETDARRQLLDHTRRDAERRVQQVEAALPVRDERVSLTLPGGGAIEVTRQEVVRLRERLWQLHSSANYGGNIEASPPPDQNSAGKIVVGNSTLEGGEQMDPDLLRLLLLQRVQPVAQFDTTWLDVGHIDELFTFVPTRARPNVAVLRASAGLALSLIRAARAAYRSGLSEYHPYKDTYRPSGILSRHTDDGRTPVTHLFRGRLWLHHHPQDALQVLEPPLIYRKMADVDSSWGISVHNIPYWPGEGDDRVYHAGMSVHEILHFEVDGQGNSVNEFIEANFFGPLDARLGEEFPDTPIVRLPVVFDAIATLGSWADNQRRESTKGFTPNLVNLQVVNGHVLIPRPYGPRMRPADAIAVVRQVLNENDRGNLGARLDARFLHGRRLDRSVCWMRQQSPVRVQASAAGSLRTVFDGIDGVTDLARIFKDGFPGVDRAEVETRIQRANRRDIGADGRLRDGWRRLLIPENTVDLFEAYTQVVLESLGLQVHWVDSWYYHVRFGEIHCGTNVIRTPQMRGQVPWWRVTQVDFGEEEAGAGLEEVAP